MPTTHMTLLLLVLAVGCTVGEDPSPVRGDESASLVLSGSALDRELMTSPPHQAPLAFRRVGVMFDSDRPGAIEVATSVDGVAWSSWRAIELRHIEVEGHGAFVGEVAVEGEAATRFKLRGTAGRATWARVDVLAPVSSEWEGDQGDEAGANTLSASLALPGVTIRSRADWNARAATCTSSHTPKKLTIHHTDTPNADTLSVPARLRQIQSYHRDVRGWCDVGYHYLISADGQIWEGRPIAKLGAHTASANTNNVGIALIGAFEASPPSAAQVAATAALSRAIGKQYGITISRTTLKGHREQGSTATDCPGAKTFALLASIVESANRADVPPPPGGETPGDGSDGGEPGAVIEGVVYEASDPTARIAGATVTIAGASATTSATGTYELTGVSPGVHEVRISKASYQTTTLTRNTSVSSFIGASLTRSVSTGTGVLQGVIYRGADHLDRVGYATVTLSTGKTLAADANGYYITTALPAGSITITASAPGYAARSVTRTLANGQTEWGSVSLQ